MSMSIVIVEAGSMTSDITKGLDVIKSVFKILERQSHIDLDDENGVKLAKLQGNINVKDVYFVYPIKLNLKRSVCMLGILLLHLYFLFHVCTIFTTTYHDPEKIGYL